VLALIIALILAAPDAKLIEAENLGVGQMGRYDFDAEPPARRGHTGRDEADRAGAERSS
jgi:hypothetical protein